MRIILLGGGSFAGRGLAAKIEREGHECITFSRGKTGRTGSVVSGPVDKNFSDNPHWPKEADWIINFVYLKGESIEANMAFCRQVLDLARRLKCRGVIHISSIMTCRFSQKLITVETPPETHYEGKPFYSAVKIATDECLREAAGEMKVLFVRPGFILGSNHSNLMVGTAGALPGGWILLLGNRKQFFPLTSREKLAEALLAILRKGDWSNGESFLIVDSRSPTKGEYIRACMTDLGQGRHLLAMGSWFWVPAAVLGEGLARLMGNRSPCLFSRIWTTFKGITYNSSSTEAKLGISLGIDWRKELAQSYERQTRNFKCPKADDRTAPDLKNVSKILFFGVGGIVRQKHLPALHRLGFSGSLDVYDPRPEALDQLPYPARRVGDPSESDATVAVIASPPAFHTDALRRLPPTVTLVMAEKPLVVDRAELDEWLAAAKHRKITLFHNYRLKDNVLDFLRFVETCNPGELQGVRVCQETGLIAGDPAKWRRDERISRTLLYDFGLHSLDLAAAFGRDYQGVSDLAWKVDSLGNPSEICGSINFANYPIRFQLRQGHGLSCNQIVFDFANYKVRLTFNPDTFVVLMGMDMIVNRFLEGFADCRFILRYIFSKLRHRDQDASHVRSYQESLRYWREAKDSQLALGNVTTTYRFLSDISRQVYGAP